MKLRDTKRTHTRVYNVVTSSESQKVIRSRNAAFSIYVDERMAGNFPVRLDRHVLDARHLDGLLVHGSSYFDALTPETLRECSLMNAGREGVSRELREYHG